MSAHYNESIIKHSTALLQGLPCSPRSICSDLRFELVPAPEAPPEVGSCLDAPSRDKGYLGVSENRLNP